MLEVRGQRKPKTIYEWYVDYKEGRLDLAPSYGRNSEPWSVEQQALLVKTVLNGWDMPKFYLADFTYGVTPLMEQRKPYAVIDGRQRFEALFGFMDEKVALDVTPIQSGGLRHTTEEVLVLEGATMRDLMMRHPGLVGRFENFGLSVMSVIADTQEDVEELMRRLEHSPAKSSRAAVEQIAGARR